MPNIVRKHWAALLAVLPILPSVWREMVRLFDWGGRIDLIATKLHEAGGMSGVLAFLLNPPSWLIWPALAAALLFILWDKRRNEPVTTAVFPERSRLSLWGPWVLIVGGPLLGLLWLYFEPAKQLDGVGTNGPAPQITKEAAPSQDAKPPQATTERQFTTKTVRQLLALYEGRTAFQADRLIDPFKGLWIEAESRILNILPDGQPGHSVVVLKDEKDVIECRLGPEWSNAIARLDIGDALRVIGKISPNQNGQQLYLLECEIAPTTKPSAPAKPEKSGYSNALQHALIENPDRVKGSPIYIGLKYALTPDPRGLGAVEKVQRGKEELQKLYAKGMQSDFESYLIAGHVAEWLRESARQSYASSVGYHDVVRFIEERMATLHALFSGSPAQQNDGKVFLILATRRVFTETHKTKAAIDSGINGKSADGILEWYALYLIDECKVPVWGLRSPGNAEELIAWDSARFRIRIVDWAASIEDKETGAVYNDLRVRESDLDGAAERLKLTG